MKTSSIAPKVDAELTSIYSRYLSEGATSTLLASASGPWSQTKPSVDAKDSEGYQSLRDQPAAYLPKLIQRGDQIVVDATASGSTAALQADLARLGLTVTGVFGSTVSGWLPVSAIPALNNLSSLRQARPTYQPLTSAGLVASEGDAALRANVGKGVNNLDGAGVTVGVMSDSFNSRGGYSTDVASGDLPANLQILSDLGPGVGTDEGRAMAQLIYDVAPGASIAFASASLGEAAFAQGILNLAHIAGANVINDDVFYYDEPFFQDGIIAQAVNQVKSQGVAYFSSAGNFGRDAYESDFRDSGVFDPQTGLELHNFNPVPGGSVDTDQHFTIPFFGGFTMILQWDQPYASATPGGAGSQNDVDAYLRDASGNIVAAGSSGNIGGNPVEIFSFTNFDQTNSDFYLQIGNFAGQTPGHLKYVLLNGGSTVDEYATNTGASFGHSNAAGAAGVAAAPYFATPAFGVSPALVESTSAFGIFDSSAGGTAFLFDAAGNRLASPELRQQPRITGVDGTSTTVPGFGQFFGTSAAAPHAAAVAALMLQANPGLSPDQIYSTLQATAHDMDDPFTPGFDAGFDFSTGYGLIDAASAIAAVRTTSIYGHVFQDADNNAVTNLGDSAFVGVTVFLDANHDGALSPGEWTTVTDNQGSYRFTSLPPGTYDVRALLPSGYVLTTSAAYIRAKVQADQTFEADFGASKSTSISGSVFSDLNGDGTRQTGEAPLPNTLVYLDTNGNGVFDTSRATFSGPSSLIGQSVPVTYLPLNVSGVGAEILDLNVTIHLTFPVGSDFQGFGVYLFSPSGTLIELAPSGAPGSGFFDTTFDDQATTIIFAGTPPYTGSFQPAQALATFNGEDANGQWMLAITNDFSNGDGSLDSWSLDLTTGDERSTRTDAQGNYIFTGLVPGAYNFAALAPAGLVQSLPLAPGYSLSGVAGQSLTADFGFRQANIISGQVIKDANANGVIDPGESGLPGQLVFVDQNGDGVRQGFILSSNAPLPIPPVGTGGTGNLASDVTTSTITVSGVGTISDLKVSLNLYHTYDSDLIISLVSPSGTTIVLSAFNGGSGDNYLGTVFDDFASISIDAGSAPFSGGFQPDQPLSTFLGESADGTWTITIQDTQGFDSGTLLGWGLLFNNATVEPSTYTDNLGRYSFSGLAPGSYVVIVEPSSGYSTSFPGSGSQNVTLIAEGLAFAPFALAPVNAIVGTVFRDLDGNAAQGPGEPGLANIPIVLDLNNNGAFDQSSLSNAYAGADVPFGGESGTPSIIDIPLTISSGGQFISHVSVTINIDHNYLNDVIVTLISPSGVRLVLVANVQFVNGSFTGTTFDDDASISINQGTPNFTGTFRPLQPLSSLIGGLADGVWTLEVQDAFPIADDGVFHNWTLNLIATPDVLSKTDSQGNYEFTGIAPGSYNVLVLPPSGLTPNGPVSGVTPITIAAGGTAVANFSLQDTQAPQIVDVVAHWGVQSISLLNMNRSLPWATLSSIDIVFSKNIAFDPSFFSLVGARFGSYDFTVTYNPATRTATLRIAATTAFGIDQLTLGVLSDAAQKLGVQDNPGGGPGNFLNGGSFSISFKVLPGDVDGNGVVNVLDALSIRTDMALAQYFYFADLDGDGFVDVNDFNNARKRNGKKI